jgi:hypothetical protein
VNALERAANEILRRDGKAALRLAGIRLDLRPEPEERASNDEIMDGLRELIEQESQSRTPPSRWRNPK